VDRTPESILASILEKLERIEEEAARLTALTHAFVTPEHRQEFLSSTGQIWQDATAIGELANRAISSGS
jgi:hypothetical protein